MRFPASQRRKFRNKVCQSRMWWGWRNYQISKEDMKWNFPFSWSRHINFFDLFLACRLKVWVKWGTWLCLRNIESRISVTTGCCILERQRIDWHHWEVWAKSAFVHRYSKQSRSFRRLENRALSSASNAVFSIWIQCLERNAFLSNEQWLFLTRLIGRLKCFFSRHSLITPSRWRSSKREITRDEERVITLIVVLVDDDVPATLLTTNESFLRSSTQMFFESFGKKKGHAWSDNHLKDIRSSSIRLT